MTASIFKVLEISTAHLPQQDCMERLPALVRQGAVDGYLTETGLFLVIPYALVAGLTVPQRTADAYVDMLGAATCRIMRYASSQWGCWGVLFEADADTYPSVFEEYDW